MRRVYWLCPYPLRPESIVEPGNWGRVLRQMSIASQLRLGMILREYVFEIERLRNFPTLPSRFDAIFLLKDIESSIEFRKSSGRIHDCLYEVALCEPGTEPFEAALGLSTLKGDETVDQLEELARRYWAGGGDGPRELLVESPIRVVRRIPW